jgi:regulator of protease activity HflC (stomatin/prohibitin superfamily)
MNTADLAEPGERITPAGPTAKPGWRYWLNHPVRWTRAHHFYVTLSLLILAFLLVVMWREVVVSNHSGEAGVYWSRFFGGTSDRILGEGIHFKLPWDEIIIYNTRVIEVHGKTTMLTRDGMEIRVEWSARYRVDPARLPRLHREVGPLYADKVIVPEVISSLRQVLGNYTGEEIYSRDENGLIKEIDTTVKSHVQAFHPLILERVVLLHLDLPDAMAKGIVDKLLFEQTLLAYRFRLGAEEQERKRKLVEAQGIRDFEQISGISMLKWRGIDATQDLAKSPNAKIIIMGTGQNQLPILLNADQAGPSVPATSTATSTFSPRSGILPDPATSSK